MGIAEAKRRRGPSRRTFSTTGQTLERHLEAGSEQAGVNQGADLAAQAAAAARLEEAARTGDADRMSELDRQLRDEALRAREYLRARQA